MEPQTWWDTGRNRVFSEAWCCLTGRHPNPIRFTCTPTGKMSHTASVNSQIRKKSPCFAFCGRMTAAREAANVHCRSCLTRIIRIALIPRSLSVLRACIAIYGRGKCLRRSIWGTAEHRVCGARWSSPPWPISRAPGVVGGVDPIEDDS